MTTEVELVVVGGGPAGLAATLQARELGARVTLLEADQVGGTSLNRGPAPVRTLARAARLMRDWSSWDVFGLEGARPVANLERILANSSRVARYAHEVKRLADRLVEQGVDLVEGVGSVRFVDPHTLRAADGRSWSAQHIILAVGGHAARLAIPGAELALTYGDIRTLEGLPGEVAVIGAADTGCQIASILADFGVTVTVFEVSPVLIPSADATISAELARAFTSRGMRLHTSTAVQALEAVGDRIRIRYLSDGAPGDATVHAVFFAVGWPASIDELALDVAGVTSSPGSIPVDEFLRTNVEHIFAAGDVNGRSMLVQSARLEGRTAAHNAIAGPSRSVSYDVVPSGSFTDPEYGRVGLTEAEAAQDHELVVGVAWYDDLLRPVADGRPDGLCKLIADRDTRAILGAHVLGEYSAEVVQVVAACMAAHMPVDELAELQFAFPTFTEGLGMAAQKICRTIGIGQFPQVWSDLGLER